MDMFLSTPPPPHPHPHQACPWVIHYLKNQNNFLIRKCFFESITISLKTEIYNFFFPTTGIRSLSHIRIFLILWYSRKSRIRFPFTMPHSIISSFSYSENWTCGWKRLLSIKNWSKQHMFPRGRVLTRISIAHEGLIFFPLYWDFRNMA